MTGYLYVPRRMANRYILLYRYLHTYPRLADMLKMLPLYNSDFLQSVSG